MDDKIRRILDFESEYWKYAAEKERQMQIQLGISPTEYYMLLGKAIEQPAALEYKPALVKRLREISENRISRRTGA